MSAKTFSTQARIDNILKREYGLTDAQLVNEAELNDDLGIDSLSRVELIQKVEDEFRLSTVPDHEVESINTYGALIACIEARVGA